MDVKGYRLIKSYVIPVGIILNPGQKATIKVKVEPEPNRVYVVDTVLVSKFEQYGYQIFIDGKLIYPPIFAPSDIAPIPPSDIDAPDETFLSPEPIFQELKVIVYDLRDSGLPNNVYVKIKVHELLKETQ